MGKQTEAINEYNIVIRLDPNNLNALYALGSLYKGLGLADSAIHAFQRMIILNPDIVDVHKNLVFLYLENKNDREMSQYYLNELLRIDPSQSQNDDIKQALERLNLLRN